jgi:hypothetical protein
MRSPRILDIVQAADNPAPRCPRDPRPEIAQNVILPRLRRWRSGCDLEGRVGSELFNCVNQAAQVVANKLR